jgi:hypothetical protein
MEELLRTAASDFIAKKCEDARGSPVFFPTADRRGVARGKKVLQSLERRTNLHTERNRVGETFFGIFSWELKPYS